ncbi:MAG: tetratricopeptide repeat protein [Candidatus Omnitrophica bacterium]|nr:tetratricopeptide repeat protein [Candidatus Omnitrophota bacterium]
MRSGVVISCVVIFLSLAVYIPMGFAEDMAKDYYARGYVDGQKGDLNSAIAQYAKAIELDPLYADAYYARGYVYSQIKNFTAAIADYTKELQIRPNDAKAYYARASIWDEQGDFVHAIDDYNKLIELSPRDASAYNSRGVAYGKQGDFVRAIADYDKAIEIDPEFVRPYYNRGLAQSLQRKDDEALVDYSKVLDMDPNSADVLNNRGITYTRKGNYEAAIVDFTKAIKLFPIETHPQHTPPYLGRAEAYLGHGRYDLAIEDCTKVVNLYPRSPAPYRLRAKAYYYQKDTDRAWADVNTIRELGQDVPIEFLLDLGALTPVEQELKRSGVAVVLPEGWQLIMKEIGIQKKLLGSLQIQSYTYMSPDKKARILIASPVVMSDVAFNRVLEEMRIESQDVLEEKMIFAGISCFAFTRFIPGEDRYKTVSYHFYKNGKAYVFAFSAWEGEYGLYKSAFDIVVNGFEVLSPPIDGGVFYLDEGTLPASEEIGSSGKKTKSADAHQKKSTGGDEKKSAGTHQKKSTGADKKESAGTDEKKAKKGK